MSDLREKMWDEAWKAQMDASRGRPNWFVFFLGVLIGLAPFLAILRDALH